MKTKLTIISFLTLCITVRSLCPAQNWNTELLSEWYDSGSNSYAVETRGNFVYFVSGGYLSKLDARDPGNPVLLDSALISDGRNEVAHEMSVFDDNENDLTVVQVYYIHSIAKTLTISDLNRFRIDRRDSLYPHESVPTITVVDTLLYLFTDTGLRIYNFSYPLSPVLLSFTEVPAFSGYNRHYITVAGKYLYYTLRFDGGIIDVSNPLSPSVVTMDRVIGDHIVAHENYVFAIMGVPFFLWEYTDVLNPIIVSQFPLPSSCDGVYYEDGNLYVYKPGGFYVYDVHNPENPVHTATFEYPEIGYIRDIDVEGNLVYLATSGRGLIIVKNNAIVSSPPLSAPSGFSLSPAYPNPVSSDATISYSLESHGYVSLSVFDALGRQVQVLNEGLHEAGMHETTFNAALLPAGMYHCVLRNGERAETQMIVVAR